MEWITYKEGSRTKRRCRVKRQAEKSRNNRLWREANPARRRELAAEYRRRHPDRVAAAQRRAALRKYGISEDDYERMLHEQAGGCAICGGQSSRAVFDVDHDHESGAVRGLLCGSCNRGIGLLGDSADRLAAAQAYLARAHTNASTHAR